MNENNRNLYIGIAAAVLVLLLIWLAVSQSWFSGLLNPGRVPELNVEDWKTITNDEGDVLLKYPENFGTEYVTPVNWPFQAQMVATAFACTEAERPEEGSGTRRAVIDGREYCVAEIHERTDEGVNTQYTYSFAAGDQHTILLTFSVKRPHCQNYNLLLRQTCQKEQESVNMDAIIDRVVRESFNIDNN